MCHPELWWIRWTFFAILACHASTDIRNNRYYFRYNGTITDIISAVQENLKTVEKIGELSPLTQTNEE